MVVGAITRFGEICPAAWRALCQPSESCLTSKCLQNRLKKFQFMELPVPEIRKSARPPTLLERPSAELTMGSCGPGGGRALWEIEENGKPRSSWNSEVLLSVAPEDTCWTLGGAGAQRTPEESKAIP